MGFAPTHQLLAAETGIGAQDDSYFRPHRAHLRYDGTDSAIAVPFGSVADMRAAFEAAYRQRYSFLIDGAQLIAEVASVEAIGRSDAFTAIPAGAARGTMTPA